MNTISVEKLADAVYGIYKEDLKRPFPYPGVRKLLYDSGEQYEGLIPDLDLFSSEIAGYCSWGKRILKWPKGKVVEARTKVGKSFFEKYTKYKPLEPLISLQATPDLYAWLDSQEKARLKLIDLFDQIMARE